MQSTIGAHRGAEDSSSPRNNSAVTESPEKQSMPAQDVQALAPSSAIIEPTISVATTSAMPTFGAKTSVMTTQVATTSAMPTLDATTSAAAITEIPTSIQSSDREAPAEVTLSTRPPNTETTQSTQPDVSLVFQTLVARIDELARETTSRLDDLAQSQVICQTRVRELQSSHFGASLSRQDNAQPRLQRVLFNDLPTPVTVTQPTNQARRDDQTTRVIDTPRVVDPSRSAERDVQYRDEEIKRIKAELKSMTSKVHQAISSAPEIDRVLRETQNTPFSHRLINILVRHQKGKIKLPTYDGTSDPREFLTSFSIATRRAHFSLEERDAGLCQLFVENLSGPALEWFSRLEANSIDSFNQLSTAFLKHYSVFIQHSASNADLWTLSQGPKESLRSFIEKFRSIASRITVIDDATVLALRNGLWHEPPFREELFKNKPQTLEDALHRAVTFIDIEEDKAAFAKKYATTKPTISKEKSSNDYYQPREHYDKRERKDKNSEQGRKRTPSPCRRT